MNIEPRGRRECGIVIVCFCFLAAALVTFLSFAVDTSKAYHEERRIQIAADAASMAALHVLGPTTSYAAVLARVTAIAAANGVTSAEVTQTPPRCGTWASDAFVPQAAGTCDATSTAVEVTINRAVPANFGKIVSINQLDVAATSVSLLTGIIGNCFRPFGIESWFLDAENVQEGDRFTISGSQDSGNWGKIDLSVDNSSSGQQFEQGMLSNSCSETAEVGSWVDVGTGFGGSISSVFEDVAESAGGGRELIFAVTSDFPNGNGTVQIQKFVKVNFISQNGRNGANWQAVFEMVDDNVDPSGNSGSGGAIRQLVK